MPFKQKELIKRLSNNLKELIEKFEREEYRQICELILYEKIRELERD